MEGRGFKGGKGQNSERLRSRQLLQLPFDLDGELASGQKDKRPNAGPNGDR